MSKMVSVTEKVRDLAYENELQVGIIAADKNGNPLAAVVGDQKTLVEISEILARYHQEATAPAEESTCGCEEDCEEDCGDCCDHYEDDLDNYEDEEDEEDEEVPSAKQKNFLQRLLGL